MMRKMFLGVFLTLGVLTTGCNSASWLVSPIKPTVEVSGHKSVLGGGFRFKSTKDDTYEIRGMRYNPETGLVELDEFLARQNSPDVIAADAQRMDRVIEAQRVEADRLRNLTDLIRAAGTLPGANAAMVLPLLPSIEGTITTPVGGGGVKIIPASQPADGQLTQLK